jgi:hypothetical protein
LGEEDLQFGDVVTTKVGASVKQESLSELPTRFAETFPRREIDNTSEGESARTLKRFHERDRFGVVHVTGFVRCDECEFC